MGQIYVFKPNETATSEGLSRSAWKATNCGQGSLQSGSSMKQAKDP